MANVTLYAGVALILFGVVAFTGALPLSVFASSVSVDCSAWPSGCTASAPVTNTGTSGFTAPFTAYFVYKDSAGSTVLIDPVPWASSQASVTDSGFSSSSVHEGGGGFSVNVFFWDSNGAPMGAALSQSFSVPVKFLIYYSTVGSITVSPAGSGASGCTSACPGSGLAYYSAYWTPGTQLTVTTSGGVAPVSWSYGGTSGANCPASGSGFACSFSVVTSSNAAFISGGSSVSQNIISVTVGGGGGITPYSICLSPTAYNSATYGACGPTGSFSISPPAQWNVQPVGGGSTIQSGFGSTASLSYANLSGKVSFQSGVASLMIVVSLPVILTVLQPSVSGVTITPAPGTYTCSPSSAVCKPGGTVQLSVTVPSGYQLNGWIVNGQNVGTANPYTLSIPQTGSTAVAAAVVSCSSSGCPPPPPPSGPPVGPSQVIGVASLMGGAALVFLGLRKKR